MQDMKSMYEMINWEKQLERMEETIPKIQLY